MYKYPYGDSQQLNLDWILAKLKELEEGGVGGGASLETVSNALISLTYNSSTQYRRYDYAFLNGKLYRCLSDTSGAFNPAAWQEALIGDDLAVLTRWINAINAAAVVDVRFNTSGTNGKIQQKYNDQYHDVVEVDYTPVQNSKRPLSSNAGYELNGAINGLDAYIRNKKIAIFGDSWSDEDIQWSTTVNDVWVKTFRTLCSPYNATITNYSRSSRGWCIKDNNNQYTGAEIIANTSLTNIDTVIIEMGLNDFLNGIWVGAYNTTSTSLMWGALNSVTQYLTGKNVFVLTPALISSTGNRVCCATLELFRIVLANWAKQNGYMLINGTTCPQLGVGSSAYDGSHIKNAFHPIFAQHVFSKMLCGGEVFNPHNEILGFNPTSLGIATLNNATIHNLSVAYYIDRVSINVDLDIEHENATASIVNAPLPALSYFEPTYLTINYNNHPMRTSYTGSDLNSNPPKTAVYFADFSSGAYTGAARARWVGTAWSNCLGKPTM